MTQECYLEVTFRKGKPLAAYYYMPRQEGDTSARVEKRGDGLYVDFTSDGRPMGIEIVLPERVTVESVNAILESYGFPGISPDDLAPLKVAA